MAQQERIKVRLLLVNGELCALHAETCEELSEYEWDQVSDYLDGGDDGEIAEMLRMTGCAWMFVLKDDSADRGDVSYAMDGSAGDDWYVEARNQELMGGAE